MSLFIQGKIQKNNRSVYKPNTIDRITLNEDQLIYKVMTETKSNNGLKVIAGLLGVVLLGTIIYAVSL